MIQASLLWPHRLKHSSQVHTVVHSSSGKQESVENHVKEILWVKSGVNTPHFCPHYTDLEHSHITSPNRRRETETAELHVQECEEMGAL